MWFVTNVYKWQKSRIRYFLREHLWSATSWRLEEVQRMLNHEDVGVVRGDGCQYGMRAKDRDGKEYPVKKPTGWMSNADLLLEELSATCDGKCETHVNLLNGRAEPAVTYQLALCIAIVKGLQRQWERDHKRVAPEIAAAICSELEQSPSGMPRPQKQPRCGR